MGLFRKKQAPPSRPVEFEFFDDRSWAAFDDQVRQSVQRLGLDVERIEPGAVFVRNQGMLGLLNVAQLCHAQPPSDWPRVLDEHFTAALSGSAGDDVLTSAQLRVRLLPDDYGPPELIGNEMVLQPFAESVNAALAFDLPTTVRMATASDLEPLGLDQAAAWELAWQQTRTSERVDQHDTVEVGGVQLHSIFGESFYVASLVRFLPDLIGDLGPHGAVVSFPRRHTVLASAIHDMSAALAVQAMIPDTRRIYAEGPGSVSAHLYWWHDGELTWLPVQVENDRLAFYPPETFVDMLNSLPPAPDS